MEKYKEELIFMLYKDKPLKVNYFKRMVSEKYNLKEYVDLYRRIVNYQIDTYGEQLNSLNNVRFTTHGNERTL